MSFLQMMAACPSQMSIFAFPLKSKYSIEISEAEIRTSTAVPPRATNLQLLNSLKLSPGVYGLPLKFLSCLVGYANQRFKLGMVGCISTAYSSTTLLKSTDQCVFIYSRLKTGALSFQDRVNQVAGDGETPSRNDPHL